MRYPKLDSFPPLDSLRLLRSENVGPVTFFQLVSRFGSPAAALEALPEISIRAGRGRPLAAYSKDAAERELENIQKHGATLIPYGAAAYPALMLHIYDPPPLLTAKGCAELLEKADILGMVGARNASMNGRHFARSLAAEMGANEFIIASGLARGIDTEAHTGALATGTIAVIAGGIDTIYPPENEALYRKIADQGVIITEQPFGSLPHAQSFPRRNRIISGMARGVIITEASLKSGSLITARFALEQGREVFAVPGSPLDSRCRGSNDLLRQGAHVTESSADVLAVLRGNVTLALRENTTPESSMFFGPETPQETIDSARDAILSHLGPSPVLVDELVAGCHVTPHILATVLLELELTGLIYRLPGNQVALRVQDAA